ncbi:MAG: methyl-accepting chemotaxis protein [Lachnospiraceae bacterium]|nr:methyl-accepting chemotaxis protein [Lachnospiraceae bacterium]
MGSKNKKTGYGVNSIRFKLVFIMIMLAAVPVLILTLLSVRTMMSDALESGEEINVKQVQSVELELNSLLKQNIRMLETIASSPATLDLIRNPANESKLADMQTTLIAVDKILDDGNSTVLTGADGENIVRSTGNLVNIAERGYFITAMKGSENISDASVSKTTGGLICVIAVPVRDEDGNPVAVLTRNYSIGVLHDMLASEVSSDETMIITDTTGAVIAHSAHEINADSEPDERSSALFFTRAEESGTYEEKTDAGKMVTSWYREPITSWNIVVFREYDSIMSSATRMAIIFIILGVVLAALAVVIALWLAGSIDKPIQEINKALEALSDGHFVTIRKYHDRKDEFGAMVKSTNFVTDKIKAIVAGIKQSASSVANSANELSESTDQISKTAEDVSSAVLDIANGATQQANEVQDASTSTGQISDNIQKVTDNSNSLAGTADTMNENSKEAAKELEKLKLSSDEMSKAVEEITERISATGAAVENISQKVEAINSIASQTNLLALNASIEAARAGEAGRGFAVVAEEISKLADDSAMGANGIKEQMTILLSESQSAISTAQQVKAATESQKEILDATIESINSLIGQIGTTVSGVRTITSDAEACDSSRNIILEAISSLSAISEENAASCEETSASMQELEATINVLAHAAEELKTVSDTLAKDMEFFKD